MEVTTRNVVIQFQLHPAMVMVSNVVAVVGAAALEAALP